ncbi:hypothetical protein DRO32_03730 [Candidatus Bathyarchaeota archaeon]|nr:MAG: hypothetical protein DRO32_03730 [Candidatus Bathyarchaeota archaeon]
MFLRMAYAKLTPLQKLLLVEARAREGLGLTMTGLARAVADERGLPLSTVKWNMARLRELGLITFRNGRKREPYVLTTAGRILADLLSKGPGRYHRWGGNKK